MIRLRALNAVGIPGQPDTIAVIIDSVDGRNREGLVGIRRVSFSVDFDASSFVSTDAVVLDTSGLVATSTINSDVRTLLPGDTVGVITGFHTLGVTDSSQITVRSASWLAGDQTELRINTRYLPGDLITTSVCEADDRKRLFDPRSTQPPKFGPVGYFDIRGQYVGPTLDGHPIGVYFRR